MESPASKSNEHEDPNHELNHDMKKSADRVEELRKGRTLGDIPLNDEYWKANKNHHFYHGSKN